MKQRMAVGAAAAAIMFALSACVTINIYFPAAAAEKAADKIIDEVWQLQKQGASANPATPTAPQK
jgi:hypothetical protein